MSKNPNIVLIMTDDQGPWALDCSGTPELRTPVLDQMAAKECGSKTSTVPRPSARPRGLPSSPVVYLQTTACSTGCAAAP